VAQELRSESKLIWSKASAGLTNEGHQAECWLARVSILTVSEVAQYLRVHQTTVSDRDF
jgi:hypothetical protein